MKDWHNAAVKIAKGIEQAMNMGKIEGYTMGARIMMRDELEDDTQGEKP